MKEVIYLPAAENLLPKGQEVLEQALASTAPKFGLTSNSFLGHTSRVGNLH